MGDMSKAIKVSRARWAAEKEVEVVLQVQDMEHAKSEEVLKFCISELAQGSTWNELRRKLGLGHASIDRRWRTIRDLLCSAVLPKDDEEALQANYAMSNFMIARMEEFIEYAETRMKESAGKKNEADFLKVKLEAMKTQMSNYQKQFEHYAELKKVKDADKAARGQSIIFQNNFYVPRPGDKVKFEDGKPVIDVPGPETDVKQLNKAIEADGNSRE